MLSETIVIRVSESTARRLKVAAYMSGVSPRVLLDQLIIDRLPSYTVEQASAGHASAVARAHPSK